MRYTFLEKELNPSWLGNKVGYRGVHLWLQVNFGKAVKCEQCDKIGVGKQIQWALIKGMNYERKRENFWQLCAKCHHKYDKATVGFKKGYIPWNKGLKTGLVPKSAFKKGHKLFNKKLIIKV